MTAFGEFAAVAAADGRAALVTIVEGGDVGAKLLVLADGGTSGGLGDAELDSAAVEAAEELMWAERLTPTTVATPTRSPRAVQALTSSTTSFIRPGPFPATLTQIADPEPPPGARASRASCLP